MKGKPAIRIAERERKKDLSKKKKKVKLCIGRFEALRRWQSPEAVS